MKTDLSLHNEDLSRILIILRDIYIAMMRNTNVIATYACAGLHDEAT